MLWETVGLSIEYVCTVWDSFIIFVELVVHTKI